MSDLTRLQAMKLGAAGAGAMLLPFSWTAVARAHSTAPVEVQAAGDLALWYDEPAGADWLRALPIGNGRLGAMVFGNTDTERLQLNEDTVWAGGPHDYSNLRGAAALPQIRQLVFANLWTQAQDLINQTMLGNPGGQLAYQPVGDLRLTLPGASGISRYERWLNLTTAATVVTSSPATPTSGSNSNAPELFEISTTFPAPQRGEGRCAVRTNVRIVGQITDCVATATRTCERSLESLGWACSRGRLSLVDCGWRVGGVDSVWTA
jgi:glycosyl hydrolase family 65